MYLSKWSAASSSTTEEDVCGDDFLFERLEAENRHLAVLSDGLGSGIKANLLASMTTTMAMKFIRSDMDVLQSAEIIMDTLPVCEIRKISYGDFHGVRSADRREVADYRDGQSAVHSPPQQQGSAGEASEHGF